MAVFLALGAAFFVLPVKGLDVFLSPDETAVATTAQVFASTGSFRLTDSLLEKFPWLHPRSFVTSGTALVPVGFLGMPLIAAIIFKLFGSWGMLLFTPLLALSVIFPLWRLSRGLGRRGQTATVAVWLTFPTVILYANRGLFPNLPCIALTVWAAYLLTEKRSRHSIAIAGLLAGLALAIRPTEAVWILPWLAAAWFLNSKFQIPNSKFKILFLFIFPLLAVCAAAAFFAWQTYGSPLAVGYFLRDPIVDAGTIAPVAATVSIGLPFGFHPRLMLHNAWTYLVGFWWPWVALACAAIFMNLKRKTHQVFIYLGAWTLAALWLMYGQASYQDHVGVNIAASGNSFLRYMLPLVPFFALAVGWAAHESGKLKKRTLGNALAAFGIIFLIGFGWWTAFVRDDEGILAVAPELSRYATVRQDAAPLFEPGTIVLSERSDKMFFPTFRAVSPMPPKEKIHALKLGTERSVLYFGTKLDATGLEEWRNSGFDPALMLESQNQGLYLILERFTKPTP
ncbi:MAG: glycosyltransferase family 39 protein [Patescibacteria group bacterium]